MIEYTIVDRCLQNTILIWARQVKDLKIIYKDYRDISLIERSLIDLFQLEHFQIYQEEVSGPFPRANRWTQIFSVSLPSLKTFKFYFQF